jgi:phasin family protein
MQHAPRELRRDAMGARAEILTPAIRYDKGVHFMSTVKATRSTLSSADPVKQMEDVVAVHKENIETVVRAGADAATKGVDKAVALTKEQVEAAVKAGAVAFKSYEDMLQFGKDNVDAIVKSGSIAVRGVKDLSHTMVTVAQASLDEQVAASKALIGAKSLKEVIDLSSSLAKTNFDKLMAESTKLTQLSTKLAEEAFGPLTVRVSAAVEKFFKTAA